MLDKHISQGKMVCEMCGKEVSVIYKVNIEGATLYVCNECKNYGKVEEVIDLLKLAKSQKNKKDMQGSAPINVTIRSSQENAFTTLETIVPNYAELVKKARETLKLKQSDLAKIINEKESLIHNIERGKIEPPLNVAKKLERALHIKLIETLDLEDLNEGQDNVKLKIKPKNKETLTLGDLIKINEPNDIDPDTKN